MQTVIQTEKLAKRYRLSQYRAQTLSERLSSIFKHHELPTTGRLSVGSLWALRDVTLSIAQGEVVGVVGRNGAGKSTFLKILSRITPPTEGIARLNGRVASLLEVGAGFHGDLSGRENVFLNGVILGMSRREIRRRFDEIVAFADVAPYIDMPVKRYSSGMYVRLAFAVAAHLESEILLVDEVLAVGDIAFQKKCLGKMGEMTEGGRTVLFVSHNLQAVRSFCRRVIVLEEGRVVEDGPVEKALPAYLKLMQGPRSLDQLGLDNRLKRGSGDVRISRITAVDSLGEERWAYETGETFRLNVSFQVLKTVESLGLYVALKTLANGDTVTTMKEVVSPTALKIGSHATIEVEFPEIPLRSGDYSLYVNLGDRSCERSYDVLDENVDLPCLSIRSTDPDPRLHKGWVSLQTRMTVR